MPATEVEVYEIKKNAQRYSEAQLQTKVDVLLKECKELVGIQVTLGVLSLKDM